MNTKISELEEQAILDGAEVIPMEQDGAKKKSKFVATIIQIANEPTDITLVDLRTGLAAKTLADGLYLKTDGRSGNALIVKIANSIIVTKAILQQGKVAVGSIMVGDPTGKAGVFNIKAGGVLLNSTPIAFDGAVNTATEIATNISGAIDNPNYTGTNIIGVAPSIMTSPTEIITSTANGYGENKALTIETVSGDDLVCTLADLTDGTLVNKGVTYDLARDLITDSEAAQDTAISGAQSTADNALPSANIRAGKSALITRVLGQTTYDIPFSTPFSGTPSSVTANQGEGAAVKTFRIIDLTSDFFRVDFVSDPIDDFYIYYLAVLL